MCLIYRSLKKVIYTTILTTTLQKNGCGVIDVEDSKFTNQILIEGKMEKEEINVFKEGTKWVLPDVDASAFGSLDKKGALNAFIQGKLIDQQEHLADFVKQCRSEARVISFQCTSEKGRVSESSKECDFFFEVRTRWYRCYRSIFSNLLFEAFM